MPNVNIGTSVFKRENKPAEQVRKKLLRDGWSETGSLGDRITYFEKTGISIRVIDAPMATYVLPSGPIAGKVFSNLDMVNQTSVMNMGKKSKEPDTESQRKGSRRTSDTLN